MAVNKYLSKDGKILSKEGVLQKRFPSLWTPKDITTTAWYDISDTRTIFRPGEGSIISQIDDKSGNNNHLINNTDLEASSNPIIQGTQNGLNLLRLQQVTLETTTGFLSNENGWSVFSAHITYDTPQPPIGSPNKPLLTVKEGHEVISTDISTINFLFDFPTSPYTEGTLYNYTANFSLLSLRILANVAGYNSWKDGIATAGQFGSGSLLTGKDIIVGSNGIYELQAYQSFNGALGELIIIDSLVTTEERQLLEGYIAWKWGLEGNLPSNHPYKNSAPISS